MCSSPSWIRSSFVVEHRRLAQEIKPKASRDRRDRDATLSVDQSQAVVREHYADALAGPEHFSVRWIDADNLDQRATDADSIFDLLAQIGATHDLSADRRA